MPEFQTITHDALTVRDLGRSVPRYEKPFGGRPVLDEDTGPFRHLVWLRGVKRWWVFTNSLVHLARTVSTSEVWGWTTWPSRAPIAASWKGARKVGHLGCRSRR